jgi:cytidine deaminase
MQLISHDDLNELDKNLIETAISMRQYAYAPYSGYRVGAALLDSNAQIHTGCNVESADLTLTSHAEMVAIDSMVKSGCLEIRKLVVAACGIGTQPAMPCGLCRQKISEFDKEGNSTIIIVNLDVDDKIVNIFLIKLSELLPYSFSSDFIK